MNDTQLLIKLAKQEGCEYCKHWSLEFLKGWGYERDCPYMNKECNQYSKFELDREKLQNSLENSV